MRKEFNDISFRKYSGGTWRQIQSNIAPAGSYPLALNMDSHVVMGSLVRRKGTSLLGVQQEAGKRCYGLYQFRDSVSTNNKVFTVQNTTIHDLLDGTKDLTGETAYKKTRFITYLNSVLRVNGVDNAKSFNGNSWITVGGAFDLHNFPAITDLAIEWKDRVYLAGDNANPDTLYYSGVADPTTRAISWENGNGTIVVEQEDGGGGIKALEKVPGYLLIFKRHSMKRWDGYSTYPEDLVDHGVPSQECVTRVGQMVIFLNESGIYATVGGYPKRLSRPIQEFINSITNLQDVVAYSDKEHAYFFIGDVNVAGVNYNNVVLKFNTHDQTWDVRSYASPIRFVSKYVNSNDKVYLIAGDDNGNVLTLDSGNDDNGKAITWSVETHGIDFNAKGQVKIITGISVFADNIENAKVFIRTDTLKEKEWKQIGDVKEFIYDIDIGSVRFHTLFVKVSGRSDGNPCTFNGFDLKRKDIKLIKSRKV